MAIPQHIIEQITDSADLVGIIGRHCTLKKSGSSFKGCCPFHKEKTPSFYVHPDKGYYHCFGCKASGNAISFLMDYEGMAFLEAMDTLSTQTGIQIPKDEPTEKFTYRKTQQPSPKPNTQHAQTHISQQYTPPEGTQPQNQQAQKNAQQPEAPDPAATQTPHAGLSNALNADTSENISESTIGSLAFGDSFNDAMFHPAEPDMPPPDYYHEPVSSEPSDMPPHPDSFHQPVDSEALHQMDSTPPDSLMPQAAVTEAPDPSGNLYELLERICQFYQDKLATQPKALLYFNQRGLSESTIETFRLGYAPNDWQHLEKAFPADIEGLKILGLVRESDTGRQYDLLRDRVIFPIRNRRGRVIGFGGRAMSNEVQPKYINSPESIVFKKQTVLYGLHEGRKAKASDWLIVEGYMDVIALHQAGIYGAVASMGTATNPDQLKKLFSFNPILTLAFDGDNAGQAAAWRTLELALPIMEDAYELKFLLLPTGDDPDSLLKSQGVDALRSLLAEAPSLSDFLYAQLARQFDLNKPEGKSKLMGAAKKLLDTLPPYGSYKKLLSNDLRERIGISFKGRQSGQTVQASDVLLDFKSQYSLEQQIIFLLLTAPQLVEKTHAIKPYLHTTSNSETSIEISKDTPTQSNGHTLFELISLIEKTQVYLRTYTTSENSLPCSHFLLTAWQGSNTTQIAKQYAVFFIQLHALQQNSYTALDISLNDYYALFLDELCLQYQEQLLTQQLKQSSSLEHTKRLNDALSKVRHQLQFRNESALTSS